MFGKFRYKSKLPTIDAKLPTIDELVLHIATKLHVVNDEDKKQIIRDTLTKNSNNILAAINALLPGTFTDTSKDYSDYEIDKAIVNKEVENKLLLQKYMPPFHKRTSNMENIYGPNIYTGKIHRILHYALEIGLLKQIEFVKDKSTYKETDKDGYVETHNPIAGYIAEDFNIINEFLKGTIKKKKFKENKEYYCCQYKTEKFFPPIFINRLIKNTYYIKSLFRDIPPITHDILVYRCWVNGIPDYVEGIPYNYKIFLSTSLFKDFSKDWCIKANNPNTIIMRIRVPAGSRVLPLLEYMKIATGMNDPNEFTEYEILLNNYGSLIRDDIVQIGDEPDIQNFLYVPPSDEILKNQYELDEAQIAQDLSVNGGRRKSNKRTKRTKRTKRH